MVKPTIIWTKTADLQLVGILEYWLNRNKSNIYPKKILKSITNTTSKIIDNPFLFKATSLKDIRVAIIGNFSLFYKTSENHIIVLAFWDNRQDPKKLLKILLNQK
jgi:hypothetical protein